MSDEIEFHDSDVAFSIAGEDLVLHFCSAYVHHWERTASGWRGEGRTQAVEMVVVSGSLDSPAPAGVFQVSDGWLDVDNRRYLNRLSLPFHENSPVRGELILANADPVKFSGVAVFLRLTGEPEYVEDLPADMAPNGKSHRWLDG